jgi:hypothetical protein
LGRFSARGVQKHHKNTFCKKSMSKTFPKISTKISMSVFLDFFCFIAFSGVFRRWEFKNTTKNVLQKQIASKSFYKKFGQKSKTKTKTDFFSIFLYHVFGRFSVRGVQNTTKNIEKTNLTPVLFWPLTLAHPPTTGGTDFFISGTLELGARFEV